MTGVGDMDTVHKAGVMRFWSQTYKRNIATNGDIWVLKWYTMYTETPEKGTPCMIYGYARVSSRKQIDGNSLESQSEQLKEYGCVEIFVEQFTGMKTDRPEWNKCKAKLKKGDTLIVTKLDRIARSASKGIELIDELLEEGVRIHILNMGMLDNTPTGKLIRNVMFSFAEFERDMILERTKEGKEIARTRPDYKEGRPTIAQDEIDKIKAEAQRRKTTRPTTSVKQWCLDNNIPRATYYRYA